MRCDVIASGVINAAKSIGMKKPIVIRLQGTNVEQANELIANRSVAAGGGVCHGCLFEFVFIRVISDHDHVVDVSVFWFASVAHPPVS